MKAIIWFRQDLRLADNPALHHAIQNGMEILPVYIFDNQTAWPMGGASQWWLHHSLQSLNESLDGKLHLAHGTPMSILQQLIHDHAITHLYWNRCYEPAAIARDKKIKDHFKKTITVESFNGSLLFEPWEIKQYKIFTPYWKKCREHSFPKPLPAPQKINFISAPGDALNNWHLLPTKPDWAGGLRQTWQPGEQQARARLADFLKNKSPHYKNGRDRPDKEYTSRLSPYLHFGEISPRQIAAATPPGDGGDKFMAEIGWREFAHHLLYHFPDLPEKPLRPAFIHFPWHKNQNHLRAWQRGQTGYPIVDAGMRQLWQTGFMHNRVRMIAASFLIKHLLIPWQTGEKWFWDTLVDADLANNAASWQWVAGCGTDASPWFRIFNPITQGQKFDPNGDYIRAYVPELKNLPTAYIYAPWEAPASILQQAGVTLGKTYPHPIVDHKKARDLALAGYKEIKTT